MDALLSTSIPNLPRPKVGKVREVYDLQNKLLIVATDRISAFDVVMANGVPDKGRVLNLVSAFWFQKLAHIAPHHLISVDDQEIAQAIAHQDPALAGRCALAQKARPLPIECVARGYIAGSLFKEVQTQGPKVHGLDLPKDLRDGDPLPQPLFTPATKAQEGHDQNISFDQAVALVGPEIAEQARHYTLALYQAAAEHAQSVGLILADTKFEFGLAPDPQDPTKDRLVWIDEALSPDSSRYWEQSSYAPGGPQPSFDKQYVRDFLDDSEWDKIPPGPFLPPDVVANTRVKYIQAYEKLTGETFPY